MLSKVQWLILLLPGGGRTTITLSNMEVFTLLVAGLILTLITIFLTVAFYVVHSGLLTPIGVGAGKPPIANITFAYKFGRGPYSEVGSIFTEATCIGPKLRCLGVYYDNPEEVPSHQLRWAVGSILAEGDEEPDPDLTEHYRKEGFRLVKFPAVTNAVVSSFPHHNMLSIFIAVYRVYPRLAEYIKEFKLCAHPFLEIYVDNVMYFMGPLSRQDEFYVEETADDEEETTPEEEAVPASPNSPPEQQILPPEKETKASVTPSPGGSCEHLLAGTAGKVTVTAAVPVAIHKSHSHDEDVVPSLGREAESPGGEGDAMVGAPNKTLLEPLSADIPPGTSAIPEDLQSSTVNLNISTATSTDSGATESSGGSTLTTEHSLMSDSSFVMSDVSMDSPCTPSPPPGGLLSGFSSESGDGNYSDASSFEEMTKEELVE